MSDFRVSTVGGRVSVVLPKRLTFSTGAKGSVWLDDDTGDLIVLLLPGGMAGIRGTRLQESDDLWCYEFHQSKMDKDARLILPVIGRSSAELVSDNNEKGITVRVRRSSFRAPIVRRLRAKKQAAQLTPPEPVQPLVALRTLVAQLNQTKDELGDSLILEVLPSGKLRALVEYS